MKITPNLSNKARMFYVLVGLALAVGPFMAGLDGWLRVAVPILGLGSIAGGASVSDLQVALYGHKDLASHTGDH